MMTDQQIFDKSVGHLLRQGQKAAHGNYCRYRTDEGLMCAIGVLINPEHYKEYLEGMPLDSEEISHALIDSDVPCCLDGTLSLLQNLRVLHDHAEVAVWPVVARILAKVYGLNTKVIDEFPVVQPT